MEKGELARLLEVAAYNLYRATIVPHSGSQREIHEDVYNPRVGDLVLEVSAYGVELGSDGEIVQGSRLGRWLRTEHEEYEDGASCKFDVIETVDGREFRWHNHKFIKVPEKVFW